MWILSSFETEDRFSFYFWVHHHCVFSVFFRLVSGFGVTQDNGRPAKQLKYVHLPVVDQETCGGQSLTDNMFCAGLPEGGKDSCSGDGGSPYALKDNGRFWAAGIVSWGSGCGRQGSYGVYTRVANYLDWITKTMQENWELECLIINFSQITTNEKEWLDPCLPIKWWRLSSRLIKVILVMRSFFN